MEDRPTTGNLPNNTSPEPPSPVGSNQTTDLLRGAVLLAIVGLVFAPSLTLGLLHGWDDNVYVTNNVSRLTLSVENLLHWFTHDCVSCYLPLTMLSYMVDYALWGLQPFGYHLQNVLWHAVAAVSLFTLMRRLGIRSWPAFLGAFLFAVHPQRVESVAWISERKDVMCAAFFMLSLNAYLGARTRNRYPWGAWLLMLAALLSKSMAISLPVVLLCLEWHAFVRHEGLSLPTRAMVRSWVARLAPFAALAAAFIPITIAFQNIPVTETTHLRQAGVALHNVLWYAAKTALPVKLSPIYPKIEFTSVVLACLALVYAVALIAVLTCIRRYPRLGWGTVIPGTVAYVGTLLPVVGLVPLGYVDMSDRYSYIPSAALWVLLAATANRLMGKRPATAVDRAGRRQREGIVTGVALLAGLSFALGTCHYQGVWRNIRALNEYACRRRPANIFALEQLSDILIDQNAFEQALAVGTRLTRADRSWMTDQRRKSVHAEGLYVQGFSWFALGHRKKAMRAFEAIAHRLETTVFHEPTNNAAIYAMMAEVYLAEQQTEKAIQCYNAILSRVPSDSFEFHFYSGVKFLHGNQPDKALRAFQHAKRLKPTHPLVIDNLQNLKTIPPNQRNSDKPRQIAP